MVAPTYPGVEDDMGITSRETLNANEIAFISYVKNSIQIEKILKNTQHTFLHISQDDTYINFSKVQEYYEPLAR